MKRNILTLIILILAALGGTLQAQRPTGDTLSIPDESYFCDTFNIMRPINPGSGVNPSYEASLEKMDLHLFWPMRDHNDSIEDVWWCWFNGNHISGRQMIAERPIKIIGIAASAYRQRPADTSIRAIYESYHPDPSMSEEVLHLLTFLNTRDTSLTTRITDSLILYKSTDKGPERLAAGPWRIEYPHRNIVLPPIVPPSVCHSDPNLHVYDIHPWHYGDTAPRTALYEVIFDHPIVVKDSFIIAGTALNNDGSYSWQLPPIWSQYEAMAEYMWLWDYCPTRYWYWRHLLPVTDTNCVTWLKFRDHDWIRYSTSSLLTSFDTTSLILREVPVMFPIIVPFDTLFCHGVSNLRLAGRSGNNATLMWDSDESGPWEVAYGKASAPRDSFSVVNTSVPTVRLSGFDARTPYHAYVRGYCDLNDSYSDWIGPLEFQVYEGPAQPGDTTAIDQPGSMASFIQLLPNPATSQVQILSSYKMDRIVLFDLGGRTLLDQPADGISSLLDLSALPKGSYIVAIHSAKSIATKKLIVE